MAKKTSKTKSASKAPSSRKPKKIRGTVAATGIKTKARIIEGRIAESGKTSRIKGHIGATGRKNQAKRDERNSPQLDEVASEKKSRSSAAPGSGMNIEVSTKGGCSAEFIADVTAAISRGLSRYANRITRVEAYFEDLNGPKGGIDHRCGLEARLSGMRPVKVTHVGARSDDALKGAISKLSRLLASTLGKLAKRKNISASGEPT